MSKIEELISEIEMYLDSCKPQPFSGNKKIVVEKDVIDEMLVELRMQTPEEVKKYQKIISNKDAILQDARAKAEAVISDAQMQAQQLVSEHEITRRAEAGAQEIINQANAEGKSIVDAAANDANQIRMGAVNYTDGELAMLQNILSNALANTESRYNGFMKQLNDCLEVVTTNRNQLNGNEEKEPADFDGGSKGIDIVL